MKVKIAIIMFSIIATLGFTQNYRDVVIKTDGSELRGVIIENKINDYIRIELTGGSIFNIKYSDIDTIKKELDTTASGSNSNSNSIVINNTNSNENSNNATSSSTKPVYTGYLSSQLVGMLKNKSLQKLDTVKLDESKLRETDLSEKMSAYNHLESDKAVAAAALNFFIPVKGVGSFYQGDINQGVTTLVVNGLLGVAVYISYLAFIGSMMGRSSTMATGSMFILIGSSSALTIYNIVQTFLPFSYEKKFNSALKAKLKY
jgi:TM2 domain-containing membrane protein YozV